MISTTWTLKLGYLDVRLGCGIQLVGHLAVPHLADPQRGKITHDEHRVVVLGEAGNVLNCPVTDARWQNLVRMHVHVASE
jgi:hypothetical protein